MAGFHHTMFNYRPQPIGEQVYISAGTYTWIAPADVTRVHVVCVGGGGAMSRSPRNPGQGGGLGWKNNIAVVPGQSYTVVVGTAGIDVGSGAVGPNGGTSYFISDATVAGIGGRGGGNSLTNSGGYVGDGGGNGGAAASGQRGAGGGAGGYSGDGGAGQQGGTSNVFLPGIAAPPGGGGGGGGAYATGAGGGGVGIFGEGASGGASAGNPSSGNGGLGGSGGGQGGPSASGAFGGTYGGGSGCQTPANGGGGAVRIIWGDGRSFPSTNAGIMT